jgi:hypothetical protein
MGRWGSVEVCFWNRPKPFKNFSDDNSDSANADTVDFYASKFKRMSRRREYVKFDYLNTWSK